MSMKMHNLLVMLTVAVFIAIAAAGYLESRIWQLGGPYNLDSDNCGYSEFDEYDSPIVECLGGRPSEKIAGFLATGGALGSVVLAGMIVREFNRRKGRR